MAYKSTYGAQIISQKIDEIISCLQDSAFDNYFIRIGKQRRNLLQLVKTAAQKIQEIDDAISFFNGIDYLRYSYRLFPRASRLKDHGSPFRAKA